MDILKYLLKLLKKGFATSAEKDAAKIMFKNLEEDQQAEAQETLDEVEALPETAPADNKADDKNDDAADGLDEEAVKALLTKTLNKVAEDVKNEFKADYEKFLEKQAELKEKKVGLYNNDVQKTREAKNQELRKFIGAVIAGDVMALKDMSTATDAAGGYLLQPELVAEIQHLMTEYGVARREFFVFNMGSKTINLNNLSTDLSVSWTDEAAAKTSTDVTIGRVSLTPKKITAIIPLTDELLEDSEFDLVSFLTDRVAEKMSQKEDDAFFNGNGTATYGGFTGILRNGSVNVVTMAQTSFANIDADDLLDMIDSAPQHSRRKGKFYMDFTIQSYIRKLKDTQGNYIYQAPVGDAPATVWGRPVVDVEVMPAKTDTAANTAFVIYGDLKKAAWMGVRKEMTVAKSTEATVKATDNATDLDLFRLDMTALRFVERVGYALVLPTAVVVLKTAASSI